ncbi:hypothetical protein [Bacillus cereus]|uniref:hypothetical protein n=1 Tax=Bacillus cereus TaxID=1396 RepID=UPI003D657E6F
MTIPVDPISPTDSLQPQEPIRPVTVNTWGINFAGVIQQGNTLLNRQFAPTDLIQPVAPV